jgi:uncharacterized protein YbbK (DUF523 family)/uncharacterized protein YbgA (DUF1722 family)
VRPRVAISACLLGRAVRWDGGHKRAPDLLAALGRRVEWVPVCPEVELGLGVPREPIRLVGAVGAPRLVAVESGRDLTVAMRRFADARIAALATQRVAGFVAKSRSPSCGLDDVPVGEAGLFTRTLRARMPLLPVADERDLDSAARRADFLRRVLAYQRWQTLLVRRPSRARLAAFHAAHELELLAHDPARAARLARIVARAGRPTAGYGATFMRALATPTTCLRHAGALRRAVAMLPLVPAERRVLATAIARYRHGQTPLATPLGLVRRHAQRLGVEALLAQTYLRDDA